ncbi:unnamed protein product [Clonostachys rosea f. rosea IK726]|uniref:Uncharacterized protein n=1 Tax=Clonostachys rosea f. rosea IK726 TaxID=1349383 RepID=A0ACA9TD86_BIOOC|nr:unnamed protein product [Clonostachys rosea f. rosea IK726]
MCQSEIGGGFLCDAMGMGKSLTALNAALLIQRQRRPNCGFILIVCPKSCVNQWYNEVQKHYLKKTRPKCYVLTKKNWIPQELLQYDIVICSEGFLRSRAKEFHESEAYHMFKHLRSPEWLKSKGLDSAEKSLMAPLHSGYYTQHNKQFAAVIIDESHLAKRLDYQLNEASIIARLRSIPYQRNEVCDIAGDIMDDPRFPGCLFMKRLLVGAIIARPLDVIKLPPIEVHKVSFGFDSPRFILAAIETHVSRGRKLLAKAAHTRNYAIKDGLKAQAFGHLTRAQQYAACPVVLKAQDCHVSQNSAILDVQNLFVKFLMSKGMDQQTQMDELTRDEFREFRQHCRGPLRLKLENPAGDGSDKLDNESGDGLFLGDGNHFDDDRINEQDMINIAAQESLDEGFIYADEDNDETCDPEIGDMDLVDEITYEQETFGEEGKKTVHEARRKTRSNTAFTLQWKRKLNTFPDIEIFTPRVQAVLNTVKRIADKFPGEGMAIASSSLLFLDVIQEALERLAREDEVLQFKLFEYNGTVDIDQRATTISEFNESDNQTRALLVTAGVGGVGVNIHSVSHLILIAPLWTPGQKEQFIGRVRRIPQRRKVHIWEILAEYSAIDMFMMEKVVKKKQVITMLEKYLVRKDTRVIIQERQPDSSDLEQFLRKGEKHNS